MKVRRRENPDCVADILNLAALAWCQNEEFQETPCREFVERVAQSLPDNYVELVQLAATRRGPVPTAFAIIAEDEDMHYGKCASVQWNYCTPAHRGNWFRKVYKELLSFAKERGIKYIAYTHKVEVREYRLVYRRIHG